MPFLFAGCPDQHAGRLVVCSSFPTCRDGYIYSRSSSSEPAIPCLDGITYIYNKDFTESGTAGDPTTQTYVISEPGRYVLCEPLHFRGDASHQVAIDIRASNVTLDFNQFSLIKESGFGVEKGVIIRSGYSNVVVRGGGTIADFSEYALEVSNASKIFICSMRLYNAQNGFYAENGEDISICSVEAKNGGIKLSGGQNILIEDCYVQYMQAHGIQVSNADGVSIKKSTVLPLYSGSGASIYLDTTTRTTIDGSNLTGYVSGESVGIEIKNSPKVIVSNSSLSFYKVAVRDDTVVGAHTTTSLFSNKFIHNVDKASANMYGADNSLFIEVVGNPHNLTGLTEFKSYQNVVVVEDLS